MFLLLAIDFFVTFKFVSIELLPTWILVTFLSTVFKWGGILSFNIASITRSGFPSKLYDVNKYENKNDDNKQIKAYKLEYNNYNNLQLTKPE